jgi:hypothetical protein
MTTIHQLLQNTTWADIFATPTMQERRPAQVAEFRKIHAQLLTLDPVESRMQLLAIKYTAEETGRGPELHVCGIDGSLNEIGGLEHFNMCFERWEQWLGLEIAESSLTYATPAEIVAEVLVEMSWDGTTQIEIGKRKRYILGIKSRIFLSHASEDKDEIARPLTLALEQYGHSVWFDEFELLPGDSLRKQIADGIAKSKCAIVVLSKSFLRKAWTERELAGITAMQTTRRTPIIPIWHGVSIRDVVAYDASLADKVAMSTDRWSIPEMAAKIHESVESRKSRRR